MGLPRCAPAPGGNPKERARNRWTPGITAGPRLPRDGRGVEGPAFLKWAAQPLAAIPRAPLRVQLPEIESEDRPSLPAAPLAGDA